LASFDAITFVNEHAGYHARLRRGQFRTPIGLGEALDR
jgi:hypothetical protein